MKASEPWLTRTVWGMAATSFLSDLGHEAQSTLLPSFMAALGLPPVALGVVEGSADAAASFIKLGAGWISDRVGHRKGFVVLGYLATGLASGIIALAHGALLIAGGKLFGWLGRGLRGPLRDAMLTDSIPAEARGRAFGFHRFGDTLGAILGPLAAMWLLGTVPLRPLMAWTLVPGVLAGVVFALCVAERARTKPKVLSFRHALRAMPEPYRRYLGAVGIFGAGDFAHTLLILAATQLTGSATQAAALYVLHNVVYAAAAYPAGALADRLGHRRILGVGYLVAALAPLALIACFRAHSASWLALAVVFVIAGLANGVQDTLESAATADLVAPEQRGLGFGLLGAVNGFGDLASSFIVGGLWTVSPTLGFGYATLCMAAGGAAVLAL